MRGITEFQEKMTARALSLREQTVVLLLLKGYPYRKCAEELGVTVDTIKFHARNAYRKLDVSGRHGLFSAYVNEKDNSAAQ